MSTKSTTEGSYHANFPIYQGADLVVKSSDQILFATRALYLRAASSVFDDILGLPTSNKEKKDGHPLIKIEETGEIFEIFLRYAHRGRLILDGKAPAPSWKQILLLSKFFDKYDSPNLSRSILTEQLPRFLGDPKDFTRPQVSTSYQSKFLPSLSCTGSRNCQKLPFDGAIDSDSARDQKIRRFESYPTWTPLIPPRWVRRIGVRRTSETYLSIS